MAVDVMTLLLNAGADPTARINGKARGGRDTEGTSAMRMLLWAPQSSTSIPSNLSADDWAKALETMLRTESVANAPVDAEGLTPLLTLAQNIGRGWRAGEANWAELATGILLRKGGIQTPECPPKALTVRSVKCRAASLHLDCSLRTAVRMPRAWLNFFSRAARIPTSPTNPAQPP